MAETALHARQPHPTTPHYVPRTIEEAINHAPTSDNRAMLMQLSHFTGLQAPTDCIPKVMGSISGVILMYRLIWSVWVLAERLGLPVPSFEEWVEGRKEEKEDDAS